ncbi:MAG: hypothetical protein K0S47_1847 [Herbinix sp.]|jgi:hypothetical protein|nr:hypothetical protein [Herbinix sp.]
MSKIIKRILICLVLLTAGVLIAVLLYTNNRTYYNDKDTLGNLPGNINNGGLFCERDGKIYFSNDNDNGSLYVMSSLCTNIKKLYKDKTAFINVDDNYIYYLRANNTKENSSGSVLVFNNTGVYRINQNGSGIKGICNDPGSYITLAGNYLYFQRYQADIGLDFIRYKIDGKDERQLFEEPVIPAGVLANQLYYTNVSKDHNLQSLDLSSFTSNTVITANMAMPFVTSNYIYYINLDDKYSIYRIGMDGSDNTKLVKERCSTYNITLDQKYLIYQVDNGKNNRICRLNLETMEEEIIMEGNFKQIHVTENYIFFKQFEDNTNYILNADGTGKPGKFNPPNLTVAP